MIYHLSRLRAWSVSLDKAGGSYGPKHMLAVAQPAVAKHPFHLAEIDLL